MPRLPTVMSVAIVAGIAAVILLPPPWLEPMATVAAGCALVLAIIVRTNTKTEALATTAAGVLLSIINLPEQPLAKVTEGRSLTAFLASAAFLLSLALSVMVRANV